MADIETLTGVTKTHDRIFEVTENVLIGDDIQVPDFSVFIQKDQGILRFGPNCNTTFNACTFIETDTALVLGMNQGDAARIYGGPTCAPIFKGCKFIVEDGLGRSDWDVEGADTAPTFTTYNGGNTELQLFGSNKTQYNHIKSSAAVIDGMTVHSRRSGGAIEFNRPPSISNLEVVDTSPGSSARHVVFIMSSWPTTSRYIVEGLKARNVACYSGTNSKVLQLNNPYGDLVKATAQTSSKAGRLEVFRSLYFSFTGRGSRHMQVCIFGGGTDFNESISEDTYERKLLQYTQVGNSTTQVFNNNYTITIRDVGAVEYTQDITLQWDENSSKGKNLGLVQVKEDPMFSNTPNLSTYAAFITLNTSTKTITVAAPPVGTTEITLNNFYDTLSHLLAQPTNMEIEKFFTVANAGLKLGLYSLVVSAGATLTKTEKFTSVQASSITIDSAASVDFQYLKNNGNVNTNVDIEQDSGIINTVWGVWPQNQGEQNRTGIQTNAGNQAIELLPNTDYFAVSDGIHAIRSEPVAFNSGDFGVSLALKISRMKKTNGDNILPDTLTTEQRQVANWVQPHGTENIVYLIVPNDDPTNERWNNDQSMWTLTKDDFIPLAYKAEQIQSAQASLIDPYTIVIEEYHMTLNANSSVQFMQHPNNPECIINLTAFTFNREGDDTQQNSFLDHSNGFIMVNGGNPVIATLSTPSNVLTAVTDAIPEKINTSSAILGIQTASEQLNTRITTQRVETLDKLNTMIIDDAGTKKYKTSALANGPTADLSDSQVTIDTSSIAGDVWSHQTRELTSTGFTLTQSAFNTLMQGTTEAIQNLYKSNAALDPDTIVNTLLNAPYGVQTDGSPLGQGTLGEHWYQFYPPEIIRQMLETTLNGTTPPTRFTPFAGSYAAGSLGDALREVLSRATPSDIPHADITAIKNKTDQLTFTGGLLNAVAKTVEDKTGYDLTDQAKSLISASIESALLDEGDGRAVIDAIVQAVNNEDITTSAVAQAVWGYADRALTVSAGLSQGQAQLLEDIKTKVSMSFGGI